MKQNLLIRNLLVLIVINVFASNVAGQGNNGPQFRATKETAQKLLLGKWKGASFKFKCDDIAGFNQVMGMPMMEMMYSTISNKIYAEYKEDLSMVNKDPKAETNFFEDTTIKDTTTSSYELSNYDGNLLTLTTRTGNLKKVFKLLYISEDTLITSLDNKANDPNFEMLLAQLGAAKDTDKIITATITCIKIKEANAPWTLANDANLSERQTLKRIINRDSVQYKILAKKDIENDLVYVSKNNGHTWSSINEGLPKQNTILDIALSEENVLLLTNYGVYILKGKSDRWDRIKRFRTDISQVYSRISIDAFGDCALIKLDDSVFISRNYGINWNAIKAKQLGNNSMVISAAASENKIIISGSTEAIKSFTLISSDKGASFTDIQSKIESEQCINVMATTLISKGATTFLTTQYGTMVSRDNENTWELLKEGLPGIASDGRLYYGNNSDTILYGCNVGIFISTDNGKKWKEANNIELREKGVQQMVVSGDEVQAYTVNNHCWKSKISALAAYKAK